MLWKQNIDISNVAFLLIEKYFSCLEYETKWGSNIIKKKILTSSINHSIVNKKYKEETKTYIFNNQIK